MHPSDMEGVQYPKTLRLTERDLLGDVYDVPGDFTIVAPLRLEDGGALVRSSVLKVRAADHALYVVSEDGEIADGRWISFPEALHHNPGLTVVTPDVTPLELSEPWAEEPREVAQERRSRLGGLFGKA